MNLTRQWLYYPALWLFCVAVVIIGFRGRAYILRWGERWAEPLPDHQIERYLSLLERGHEPTIERLVKLVANPDRSVRRTALFLLDMGGHLDRLPEEQQIEYWVQRLQSPGRFDRYARYEATAQRSTASEAQPTDRFMTQLWEHRDRAAPHVILHAQAPTSMAQELLRRWSLQWLWAWDRPHFAQIMMQHFEGIAGGVRVRARSQRRMMERRAELKQTIVPIVWMTSSVPYLHDGPGGLREDEDPVLQQAERLLEWWNAHESLSLDEREALALQVLLQNGLPSDEEERLYAQLLLNRPQLTPDLWGVWTRERQGWSRLQWVVEGFQEAQFPIGPPWDREDIEQILLTLKPDDDQSTDGPSTADLRGFNALWLLERLAPELPPPRRHAWIGPLLGPQWARTDYWQAEYERWTQWWNAQPANVILRDPSQARW